MITQSHFIGIDVSKETLDVYLKTTSAHCKVANSTAGFESLIAFLAQEQVAPCESLFCFENTGMYSKGLAHFLQDRHYPFLETHPLEVKQSLGAVRGKNDKTDATRLALYAYRRREELIPSKARSQATEQLQRLASLRRKLVSQRAGHQARLQEQQSVLKLLKTSVEVVVQQALLQALDTQIKVLDKEIQRVIAATTEMADNYKLLQSVVGIGKVVATALLIYTDNFTRFDNARSFSAYCGLIPYEHQSGSSVRRKKKTSQMANQEMKSLLDRGATSVIEHDADMKAYYQRKVAQGKASRSVINAVRCKIVDRAFKVIKEQRHYIRQASEYQKTKNKAA